MADSDFAPQGGSSGLPSISEMIRLKMSQESNQRAREGFALDKEYKVQRNKLSAEGQAFDQASEQVDRMIAGFNKLSNPAQKKIFQMEVMGNPQALQAFTRAGADPSILLNPIQLSEEQQVEQEKKALRIKSALVEPTSAFETQEGIADQEKAFRIRTSEYGKKNVAQQLADDKAKAMMQYGIDKLKNNDKEQGGYRGENGRVIHGTRAAVMELNERLESEGKPTVSFIPKVSFDPELKNQEGFTALFTPLLAAWSNYTGSWDEAVADAMSVAQDGGTPGQAMTTIQTLTNLVKMYEGHGNAQDRDDKSVLHSMAHAILLGQEYKGMSTAEMREVLSVDPTLSKDGIQRPSPYLMFIKRLQESDMNEAEKLKAWETQTKKLGIKVEPGSYKTSEQIKREKNRRSSSSTPHGKRTYKKSTPFVVPSF